MKFSPLLILILLFLKSFPSFSSPINIAKLDSNGTDIIGHIQYFEDETGTININQISEIPDTLFRNLSSDIEFPFKKNWHRWFKLEITNPLDTVTEIMLYHRILQRTKLYFNKNNTWESQDISFSSKGRNFLGNKTDYLIFNIAPNTSNTYYFNFAYGNHHFWGMIYPMETGWKKNYEYIQEQFIANIFRAGFLFIIAAFCLFTFFQYFQHKDETYLWYSFYLLTILFCYFWRYGRYFHTPFTPFLTDYWDVFYTAAYYPIIIIYLLFFRSFLTQNNPTERKLRKQFKYYAYSVCAICLIDYLLINNDLLPIARNLLHIGTGLMMLIFLYILWKIFRLPHTATRFIGYGTLSIFFIALIDRWKYWGNFSFSDSTDIKFWNFYFDEMPTAILIEIIFFSLALGHRTKLLQQEKQQALKDKEIEATKSQLFTNVTHEFRTPLTVIKNNAYLIYRNPKQKLAERIEGINFYANTLESLVNDLLDLSKLQAGKMQLKKYKSDIVYYLNYLTESFASYAKENKIGLSFYCNLEALEIDFSPIVIQQIFVNLLSNALKFTPEYGQVKVILQNIESQIIIKVVDSGKGVKNEDLKNIFEPFLQVNQSIEYRINGTGLGLAIVKQLVELLDGKIKVKSEIRKGTTFTVTLPITKKAPLLSKDKLLPAKKLLFRKKPIAIPPKTLGILPKILIVEDNADVRQFFIDFLQNQFTVLTAINGNEGLELAKKEQPEFIISDEMMPEKSGFQMLEELKETQETQHIPVIMVTAKASREHILKGLSLKADAYLTKPLDEEKLLLILQNLQTKKEQATADKNLIYWQGKIVTEPFMKNTLTILENKFSNENFNATRLKIGLQRKGFGGDRKIDNLIKKHFQTTPASLIRSFRLEKARLFLLKKLRLSIPEISEQVGLGNDQSNFSKMYKKKFGKTPAEERKA